MTYEQTSSAFSGAFRSLRTNLTLSIAEGALKTIVFTSAMPSEGKTSTCLNLVIAFAKANSRILVVDADLRKPVPHKRLKLDNSIGLSNYLVYQADLDEVIQETFIPGVSLLTAGPLSPNTSELLVCERFLDILHLLWGLPMLWSWLIK